jgi:hypothetical protein
MTDQEIVDQANALARKLYAVRGYSVPAGYRFNEATHPHEQQAWAGAVAAFLMLKETDPNDSAANLEDEDAQ